MTSATDASSKALVLIGVGLIAVHVVGGRSVPAVARAVEQYIAQQQNGSRSSIRAPRTEQSNDEQSAAVASPGTSQAPSSLTQADSAKTVPNMKPAEVVQRLEGVVAAVNGVMGTRHLAVLGETGRGAISRGDGLVTIDFSLFWKLSEESLAALVAHEFAHESLGHHIAEALGRGSAGRRLAGQAYLSREQAADQYAGYVLAKLEHRAGAFERLLANVRDSGWESPLTRRYYQHHRRVAMFRRGYEAGLRERQPITRLTYASEKSVCVEPKQTHHANQSGTGDLK